VLANQDQPLVISLQNFCYAGPICLSVQSKTVPVIVADQEGSGQSDQDDATIV
jgi:hypothetical protein